MKNPWETLPKSPPYILADDLLYAEDFNRKAAKDEAH